MLEQFQFYLKHSLNDLSVNKQRTLFALLCIAAGVAAIVSLQTLGVMINDTLTGSLQEANRGDIQVSGSPENSTVGFGEEDPLVEQGKREGVLEHDGGDFSSPYFGEEGITTIQRWLDENYPGSEITYQQSIGGDGENFTDGISITVPARDTVKTPIFPYLVEVEQYPFYGERLSLEDEPLRDLIQSPTDIVLSENLAEDLEAEVGDIVRVSGINADLTVRGIVPTSAEAGLENIFAGIFGYYYLDHSVLQYINNASVATGTLYIKLGDPTQTEAADQALLERFPYLGTTTTLDVEQQNTQISSTINDLVTIMGLISLLIGGIGIVNTMLVMVSRRTTEVAVLKTLGLEPEEVTWLFMVEAFLMGLIGSIGGIFLGWIMAYVTKGYAGRFLAQDLDFQIAAQPAINGLIVGVITTGIFGFLPILAAGQIRPAMVLRPTETIIPRAGRLLSLVALLVMIMALSLVARGLIGTMFSSDTYRYMAAANGFIFAFLIGASMIAGGMYAYFAGNNIILRLIRWGFLLLILPVLGALFGYFVPTLLLITGVFFGVGLLYMLLWGLIWAVGGGTLDELPIINYIPPLVRNVILGFLVLMALVVLALAILLWGYNSGDVSPYLLGASLLLIIPFNVMLLPVFIVWGLGKFIQYIGFVDLRIAMRSMLAAKGRAASTLLALVIGVFTLSLITMLVTTISDLFDGLVEDALGGNVFVFAPAQEDVFNQINAKLDTVPGVQSYNTVASYNAELLYVEHPNGSRETYDELYTKAQQVSEDAATLFSFNFDSVNGRGLDSNLPEVDMKEGRQLTEADAGQRVIVIEANEATVAADLHVGDQLTFALRGSNDEVTASTPTITFEIVGMVDRTGGTISTGDSGNYVPIDAFPTENLPDQVFSVVEIDEDQITTLRRELSDIPGAYVLETKIFNEVINSILEQFTAFPTLVAALALFTGGIVIANSVALSTMERRREIGIMKAIGLQRERVLGMLLLENALTGFIGGLIGVGVGVVMLLALFVGLFEGELGTGVPYGTAFALMGLCIGISLLAAILTVWGASGEKPLNVLRYE